MTTENTIVRFVPTAHGDHVRMSLDMTTGEVSRYGSIYRAKLKTDAARRLFLDGVGLVYTEEVADFILQCNRDAARKPARSAKPHGTRCACPPCLIRHVKAGCRKVG